MTSGDLPPQGAGKPPVNSLVCADPLPICTGASQHPPLSCGSLRRQIDSRRDQENMVAAEASNHTPSPADRLAAFIAGGGYLGLADEELTKLARGWGARIVERMTDFSGLLGRLFERALAKYAAAAARDIAVAWQKYSRWLLAQRKRVDEISQKRAQARRDQAIATAITGLIISLKFV